MIVVRIIKANSYKRWYADKIGQIFEIEKKYPGAWVLKNMDLIDIDDAVEIKTENLFDGDDNIW